MRWIIIVTVLFFISCKSPSPGENLHQVLTGKWLLLYPDHQLENAWQKIAYSKMQDSIVSLLGLKLITLSDDGSFRQADSLETKGSWGITRDKIVFIEKGGRGFENFSAEFTSYEKKILKLTGYVEAGGEKIKLVWHLKKLSGAAADLFSNERNRWRIKPAGAETPEQIKQRLSEMLEYYAGYFELVTSEASFFIPARVVLPFRFYQHAMGMSEFDGNGFFARLFFDRQQAGAAHQYLAAIMRRLRDIFPGKDNYVKEYAAFMKMMAKEIVKD